MELSSDKLEASISKASGSQWATFAGIYIHVHYIHVCGILRICTSIGIYMYICMYMFDYSICLCNQRIFIWNACSKKHVYIYMHIKTIYNVHV